MSARHLSCTGCQIRVRADAPAVSLLEDRCPLCGAMLSRAASAASVLGFRSFDMDALSEQEPDARQNAPGSPVGLTASRQTASAREELDGERWPNDGVAAVAVAVAKWPAAH